MKSESPGTEEKRQDNCWVAMRSYIAAEDKGERRWQRRLRWKPLQELVKMELEGQKERRTRAWLQMHPGSVEGRLWSCSRCSHLEQIALQTGCMPQSCFPDITPRYIVCRWPRQSQSLCHTSLLSLHLSNSFLERDFVSSSEHWFKDTYVHTSQTAASKALLLQFLNLDWYTESKWIGNTWWQSKKQRCEIATAHNIQFSISCDSKNVDIII